MGASLAVLGLGGGPHWSQMGDIVCLDTDEIGRHDREIAYKILLWDGPILHQLLLWLNYYLETNMSCFNHSLVVSMVCFDFDELPVQKMALPVAVHSMTVYGQRTLMGSP